MKFLYGYFHPETGQSVVALSDKYGIYTGQAKVHPDDKQFASQYAGCRLAEKRAWIQKLRTELRRKKIQLKTIQNLRDDILINCHLDKISNSSEQILHRIKLKLRDYSNEIKELNENINLLSYEIKKDIEIRDNLIKRTKTDKKNK